MTTNHSLIAEAAVRAARPDNVRLQRSLLVFVPCVLRAWSLEAEARIFERFSREERQRWADALPSALRHVADHALLTMPLVPGALGDAGDVRVHAGMRAGGYDDWDAFFADAARVCPNVEAVSFYSVLRLYETLPPDDDSPGSDDFDDL